jgi:hypothetical protein
LIAHNTFIITNAFDIRYEMGRTRGAYGGGKRGAQDVGGENLRERGRWGDPDEDGRIILRWMFRKLERVVGTGWSWLRIGTGGGHLCVR